MPDRIAIKYLLTKRRGDDIGELGISPFFASPQTREDEKSSVLEET
jgi:hypothetical protein